MEGLYHLTQQGVTTMRTQAGATLAIALLLLMVITLLGVSAIQVSQLEEKMSSNLQDKLLSFTAAETALRAGEQWILAQTSEPEVYTTCPAFPCVHEQYILTHIPDQTAAWWQTNSAAYNGTLSDVASPPRYLIEFLQFIPDSPVIGSSSTKSTGVYFYQITARGTGGTDTAVSLLQTTIARRF